MAKNKRMYSRKKARASTRKGRGRAGRRASGAFKKRVLSVIRDQAETKQAWHTLPVTDFNSGISNFGDIIRIIPNVSIGANDNQRIGDQVRVTNLTVRAIVQMLPQNIGQGDSFRKIGCRVMIVTPKSYSNWATAYAGSTTWMPYLLRKGGTTAGFTGLIDDLFAPINSDAITCHYNKVLFFNQNTYGTSTNSGLVAFDQSHLTKFLKINLKMKNKLLKYDAAVDGGLTPTNAGYFMIIGYVFTDGTAPDLVSTRIRAQFDAVMSYEDA